MLNYIFGFKRRYDDRVRSELMREMDEKEHDKTMKELENKILLKSLEQATAKQEELAAICLRNSEIEAEQMRKSKILAETEKQIATWLIDLEEKETAVHTKEELVDNWIPFIEKPVYEEAHKVALGIFTETTFEALTILTRDVQRNLSNIAVNSGMDAKYTERAIGAGMVLGKIKEMNEKYKTMEAHKVEKKKKIDQEVEESKKLYIRDIIGVEPAEKANKRREEEAKEEAKKKGKKKKNDKSTSQQS